MTSNAGDLKRRAPDSYTVREDTGSLRGQLVTVSTKSGRQINLQSYQVPNIHGHLEDKILTTTTTIPSTVFTQQTQVDIRINPILSQATAVWLELTVRNSNATLPARLPQAWVLIERMELHKANGTDEITENLGEFEHWLAQLNFTQAELHSLGFDLNMNSVGLRPLTLPATETKILRLPLFNSLWNTSRFHHKGITMDMLLRVFFRVNPLQELGAALAVNGDLVLDQMQIRYQQSNQLKANDDRNTALNRSASGITYRFWKAERHIERKTMAAATTVDFVLQGVFGFGAFGLWYLVQNDSPLDNGTTGSFLTTHEIQSFDFTDAAEQTLIGGQIYPNEIVRFVHRQSYGWPGRLMQRQFIYMVPHSSDPHASLVTGANFGGYAYNDGREKLKITTGPAFPAAAAKGFQTAALTAPLEERDEYTIKVTDGTGTFAAATGGTFQLTYDGLVTPPIDYDETIANIQATIRDSFSNTGLVFDVGGVSLDTAVPNAGLIIQVSNFGANDRRVPCDDGMVIAIFSGALTAGAVIGGADVAQSRTGRAGLQGWVAGDYTLKYFTPMAHELSVMNGTPSVVKV